MSKQWCRAGGIRAPRQTPDGVAIGNVRCPQCGKRLNVKWNRYEWKIPAHKTA